MGSSRQGSTPTESLRPATNGRIHNASRSAAIIQHAEHVCRVRGTRFTPLRRLMLSLIAEQSRPVKAYKLLSLLQSHRPSAAPVAVYRSVTFLLQHGFIRKIRSMRAYTCCALPPSDPADEFAIFICEHCGRTIELDHSPISDLIAKQASDRGFPSQTGSLEIHGACRSCAERHVPSPDEA